MPEGVGVLSIEYKINLLAPADGERLLARARVVRAGRNVSVCQADVVAQTGGDEKLVAVMTATMMTVRDRPEIVG
jgi:acyl-coenzyme A thioesterase PaaI-like protein